MKTDILVHFRIYRKQSIWPSSVFFMRTNVLKAECGCPITELMHEQCHTWGGGGGVF